MVEVRVVSRADKPDDATANDRHVVAKPFSDKLPDAVRIVLRQKQLPCLRGEFMKDVFTGQGVQESCNRRNVVVQHGSDKRVHRQAVYVLFGVGPNTSGCAATKANSSSVRSSG